MTIFQFITRDVFERERDLRISQRREFGLRHRERERENVSERVSVCLVLSRNRCGQKKLKNGHSNVRRKKNLIEEKDFEQIKMFRLWRKEGLLFHVISSSER